MKPLPAQPAAGGKAISEPIPSLPGPLSSSASEFSTANRRATACPVQRAYPFLLSLSTAAAALFCLMYITKPVINTSAGPPNSSTTSAATVTSSPLAISGEKSTTASLMPGSERLPGEPTPSSENSSPSDPRSAFPGPPSSTAFEETNLRIQHILTAEAPGGHLDRIDIDVPVLYRSRNLRWSDSEVAEARDLLVRLMDYQEKTRQIRSEGLGLLADWNRLIAASIPAAELRADSPTLPENQQDAADSPRPAGLITTESIQIQTPGK